MYNRLNTFFAILIFSFLLILPASSYADWHGHDGGGRGHDFHRHDRSYVNIGFSVWPNSYYYDAPYYYPPADEVYVSAPVTVVQPPQVITEAAPSGDTEDSFTINIPNDKGSYTAVTLKRSGSGFTGPQGEFYPEFPKVSQLKLMYGK